MSATETEKSTGLAPNSNAGDEKGKGDQTTGEGVALPSVVASHYNALPEIGIQRRNDSRILHMRNLNNWMKSMLIGDFLDRLVAEGCRRARVLDLCCGKGGDLRKWRIGGIGEIVMTDIAEISLQDCRDRYQKLADRRTGRLPFKAHFIPADLSKISLKDQLASIEAPTEFDLCSCQFSLHYSFRTEQCARQLLRNATEMLSPCGYLIGTVPSASAIMQYLRRGEGHFSNQVCSISIANYGESPPPLFGALIQFNLEGVVDCPEYLCYFPLLKKILEEEMGMELVYEYSFPDAIQHYLSERGREALDLMRRMDALESVDRRSLEGTQLVADREEYGPAIAQLGGGSDDVGMTDRVGTLTKSEWEVITMYRLFAFRKKPPSSDESGQGGRQERKDAEDKD